MSELRQDPTTYDWVIISEARAKRPHELKGKPRAQGAVPDHRPDCPFCPGNEHMTPAEHATYGAGDGWEVRVVPNKFAALNPDGDTTRGERGIFRSMNGFGMHEVVIETPLHNEFIPFMEDGRVETILRAYRHRYHELKKDPRVKLNIIFKNHGEGAGTSLEHPHTQIVATPVVPPYVRRKYEVATQHYDNTGRCLHHDIIEAELDARVRVVDETGHFIVIHPFASHYPFETWIMPKAQKSSFGDIEDHEITDLARVLKRALGKLHAGLGDPDYNYIIHTAPVDDERKSYYLWHIQIIPRITMAAGFELGSGIYINIMLPEESAAFIRGLDA